MGLFRNGAVLVVVVGAAAEDGAPTRVGANNGDVGPLNDDDDGAVMGSFGGNCDKESNVEGKIPEVEETELLEDEEEASNSSETFFFFFLTFPFLPLYSTFLLSSASSSIFSPCSLLSLLP